MTRVVTQLPENGRPSFIEVDGRDDSRCPRLLELAHLHVGHGRGAALTISRSAVTVRQLRAVASTPRSRSARAASLDVPNPYGFGEPLRHARGIGHRTAKDRVAALDVRVYVGAPVLLEHQLERLHRQQMTAADVDAAEQGYVAVHSA